MEEIRKTDSQAGIPATPGFRFMGQSLGELLELKASLRKRLGYLEQNRARISSFVYEKLRQEYTAYLDTVDSELSLNLCEYEIKLAEVRLFSNQLEIMRKNYSDNIEEIKLRYRIGEYGEEEYQRLIRDHRERMDRFEESLARYSNQEQKIRAFLEQVEDQPEPTSAPHSAAPEPTTATPVTQAAEQEEEPGSIQMPEIVFRFEDEPVIAPEVPMPPAAEIETLTITAPETEAAPIEAQQPEKPHPVSSMLELRDAVKTQTTPDLSVLMSGEDTEFPDRQENTKQSQPGLEEIFAVGPEIPERTVGQESSPGGGMEGSEGDIFAAMMEETRLERQSGKEAEATVTAPSPEPPAEIPEIERRENAQQSMIDALDRHFAQAPQEVPATPQTQTEASGVNQTGLDLEDLMSVTGLPGLAGLTSDAGEKEEVEPAAKELPEIQPEPESLPVSGHEPAAPLEQKKEIPELRWEPLADESDSSGPDQAKAAEEIKPDNQDESVRRPLPVDGKIELTLDLDRSELDPRRMLTVNQTIDAIKKRRLNARTAGR